MSASRSFRFELDLSIDSDADPAAVADALLDYLCADEINGLPEAIQSVDGVDPVANIVDDDLEDSDDFTPARPFDAEGARVGIVTCRRCGAAVLVDPVEVFDAMAVHLDWHLGRR